MMLPAVLAAAIACAGLVQALIGYALVRRIPRIPAVPRERPGVTVLKPLFGAEPLLEEALASLCAQTYPDMQVVFGIQDPQDPALAVVARLRARFTGVDIAVVVDGRPHGRNHKVANLINMLPAARHEILVIADSDVHAQPGYLDSLVACLEQPGVGLATTLYAGLAGNATVAAALGTSAITHGFLPGALMARALGRQDCLGATMALRRETLARIGGFHALAQHIGDDHLLGVLVAAEGLEVALADTVTATTVPEADFADLFRHELRWARTISAVVPVQFALSTVQYPTVWAGLAIAFSGGAAWSLAAVLAAWAARALVARGIDRALGLATQGLASRAPIWLLPVRDLISCGMVVASYLGDEVVWRGRVMQAATLPPLPRLTPLPLGTEPP